MGRVHYRYNTKACRYEPVYTTGREIAKKTIVFFVISTVIALIGFFYCNNSFESLSELRLKQKNRSYKASWSILHQRIQNANRELVALIEKDDNNYRVILDSEPLSASMREAGSGGSIRHDFKDIQEYPAVRNNYLQLEKIKQQLNVEVQSYRALSKMLDEKITMWASRPAIQPINNKQLERLHMTYGSRFHPIFHTWKDHKGLDFTAAHGTPIYATGDGVIMMAYFSESYGNVIYINHGHGFETRYAHLAKFAVQQGQHVKRGQVIAYVGNTGTSVSSHLHYEVLYNDKHVNPINFFQRDLSNREYDKLIEEGSKSVEPLD
jgi:murein DD-endopeptidase MepM/ murein hydrolase activator NlpD